MAKQYKVVTHIFDDIHFKFGKGLMIEEMKETQESEIQQILDVYANEGWRLVSTNLEAIGESAFRFLVHLYFEK